MRLLAEESFARGESSLGSKELQDRVDPIVRRTKRGAFQAQFPVVHDLSIAVPESPNTRPPRLKGSIETSLFLLTGKPLQLASYS